MEEGLSVEALKRMVKRGDAENYTEKGFTRKDQDIMSIYEYAMYAAKLGGPEYRQAEHAMMILIPIDKLPKSTMDRIKDKSKFTSKDVAVCWSNKGVKTDRSNRNATLGGVAIMSATDAEKFQQQAQEDPRILMSLARAVNGGPIKKFDGTPAELRIDQPITIMANEKFGGKLKADIQSNPFPTGFNANPLF